jgi:transposase, IS6 family
VFVSPQRDAKAARRCFERAITTTKITPVEVVTDKAATCPIALACSRRRGIAPTATPTITSRPTTAVSSRGWVRCVGSSRTAAKVVIAGHAFVQNLRRGHYELAVEEPATRRVAVAFDELALAT